MSKWLYGETMLDQEDIDSLDDWSDQKEYVYSTMDQDFDYLWYEDENGIHFVDRGIYDLEDELGNEREKDDTVELHFKNLDEVELWIDQHKDRL